MAPPPSAVLSQDTISAIHHTTILQLVTNSRELITVSAYVDLHLHTSHSDGLDAPGTVVAQAAGLGFAAVAITDHDTVSGLAEAETAARKHGLKFLHGTEISSTFDGREVHVVGLGVRPDDPALLDVLKKLQEDRSVRADEIIRRLNKLGVPIRRSEVQARAGHAAIGRLHIARELRALGITNTVQKAFEKYVGRGRSAFVAKTSLPCGETIGLIHASGGLAFLAHPGIGATTRNRLLRLLELPFDGIEAYHSKHTAGQVAAFAQVAQERGLLISGGSDYHGHAGTSQTELGEITHAAELGKVHVPYAHFERIVEALGKPASGGQAAIE